MMIDEKGYKRGKYKHSDLVHRQVAYNEIYLKERSKYPLPFSKYIVHHKDGDKGNNVKSNLQIMRQGEHEKIHGYGYNFKDRFKTTFPGFIVFLSFFLLSLYFKIIVVPEVSLFLLLSLLLYGLLPSSKECSWWIVWTLRIIGIILVLFIWLVVSVNLST